MIRPATAVDVDEIAWLEQENLGEDAWSPSLVDAGVTGELPTVHDVAEGGLAVALAECCIEGAIGARIGLEADEVELFGEGAGGAVIAGPREAVETVPGARVIGEVGGDSLVLDGLSVPVDDLRAAYEGAIPSLFG